MQLLTQAISKDNKKANMKFAKQEKEKLQKKGEEESVKETNDEQDEQIEKIIEEIEEPTEDDEEEDIYHTKLEAFASKFSGKDRYFTNYENQTCFNCGQKGHVSHQCTKPKKVQVPLQ